MSKLGSNRFSPQARTVSSVAKAVLLATSVIAFGTSAKADLVISNQPTSNVDCSSNFCEAMAADAVLNVKDLKALLKKADRYVDTLDHAINIVIRVPFRWTNSHQLSLFAPQGAVIVEKPITVMGNGGLDIEAYNGGMQLRKTGRIDFWDLSSLFEINDQGYHLVGDVRTLGQSVSGGYGNIALARDYDASGDGVYSTSPGTGYFQGYIEGLGHTISNLTVNDPTTSHAVGLISYLSWGSIRDLGLVNANISGGQQSMVGGIVGQDNGLIEQSYVTGSVRGGTNAIVGGIVGFADSGQWIRNSYANATISAGDNSSAGGLMGESYDQGAPIVNCFATGPVALSGAGGAAGGLVGWSASGQITGSYATGKVQGGTQALVGGLIGESSIPIQASFATGAVTGGDNSNVGGLVGYVGGSTIYQDYATGAATGGNSANVGGLVGNNPNGDIRYVYALGAVTVGANGYAGGVLGIHERLLSYAYATGAISGGSGSTVGGVVGIDYGRKDIFRTYWDTQTSGIGNGSQGAGSPANDYGIAPLTTAQLQAGLPTGFTREFWRQDAGINNGLPYLRATPP